MPDNEPLTPEQMTPAGRNAVAAICALAGAGLVAVAGGIVPVAESTFNAPRWVVGACGFMFMIAGFLVIVPATMPHLKNFLGAAMLSVFAAVPGWIAFGPGARAFGGSFSFGGMTSATHPGETFGRIAFGFFAGPLGLAAAYAWVRWLRSVFGSGEDEGDERTD